MNNLHTQTSQQIHWGHFGVVLTTMALLLGITWMKQPAFFVFKKHAQANLANVPRYYAYVEPTDNRPLVAGASTFDGPGIINEDGTVSPADIGDVLGASTEGVILSLDDIQAAVVADSFVSIKKYFADSENIETVPIDGIEFETALSSNNQEQINRQAQKLIGIRNALQKMDAPVSLVTLHKLKIIQYNAAIGVLQNFTLADQNPQLVGEYLQQFLKSQQDLEAESKIIVQKYPDSVK